MLFSSTRSEAFDCTNGKFPRPKSWECERVLPEVLGGLVLAQNQRPHRHGLPEPQHASSLAARQRRHFFKAGTNIFDNLRTRFTTAFKVFRVPRVTSMAEEPPPHGFLLRPRREDPEETSQGESEPIGWSAIEAKKLLCMAKRMKSKRRFVFKVSITAILSTTPPYSHTHTHTVFAAPVI